MFSSYGVVVYSADYAVVYWRNRVVAIGPPRDMRLLALYLIREEKRAQQ